MEEGGLELGPAEVRLRVGLPDSPTWVEKPQGLRRCLLSFEAIVDPPTSLSWVTLALWLWCP